MSDWLRDSIIDGAASVIDGWGWLSNKASAQVIKEIVASTRNRPHPWSTCSDYTSWESLTDRTYVARHLPAADTPKQPEASKIRELFRRKHGKAQLSEKSTCLFPAFAQYLTDGFILTDKKDRRRTTTNHEIDLCPLYGRKPQQTKALRLQSNVQGRRGRLKSQIIGNEEYPPFLYVKNGNGKKKLADPAFEALDSVEILRGFDELPLARITTFFAAGGDRVNATPFSAMMNTLLLREHNRVAGELDARNPAWDDERVFQTARNIVIPVFIKIVVEDYINHITPLPFALRADPSVAWTAGWNRPNWITAEFSLLYRWHSLMPDTIDWHDASIAIGAFSLDNAPLLRVGLDAAFSAAASQPAGEIGAFNTAEALLEIEDLAIAQARSNRIDTYNNYRVAFGMPPAASFSDISSNSAVVALLKQLYKKPENVEFYPGLFAEDRVADSPLPGLLLRMVAVDAFSQALTNPLLSEHVFNASTFTEWGFDLIKQTSKLGDVLARNVPSRGATQIEMTQAGWRYGQV